MNSDGINDWGELGNKLLSRLRRFELERDDYWDDTINGVTIPFHDEDLRHYKAIEIPERKLSVADCESMAEYIIEESHALGSQFNAMKHLAYLAYNSLLDSSAPPFDSDQTTSMEPFFHKYRNYTEDWFCAKGCSNLFADMSCWLEQKRENPDLVMVESGEKGTNKRKRARRAIELVRFQASLYERKATIGAWAFSYLAAIKMETGGADREYTRPTKLLGQMMQVYSFEPAYAFVAPHLNQSHLNHLDEELLFIVLRGAIILENILHEPRMLAQRELLLDLAYYSLRGHCITLMNWFNEVAATLDVPVESLFDDFNELLLEVGLVVLARNVRILRRVFREYVLSNKSSKCEDLDGAGRNSPIKPRRYFMYARLFLHQYFHCFGSKHNEITIAILAKIRELCTGPRSYCYSDLKNDPEITRVNVLASMVFDKYCHRSDGQGARGKG